MPCEKDLRWKRPARRRALIVVCVLDEAASIDAFVAAVDGVLPSLGAAGHEYLFVDDGSSDGTWPRIEALAAERQ